MTLKNYGLVDGIQETTIYRLKILNSEKTFGDKNQ